MKLKLLLIGLAGICLNLAHADYNPVALTTNSFTFDIVVEKGAPQPLPNCISATSGAGPGKGDYTYYEQGFYARLGQTGGNSGIPIHNTIFTAQNNANIHFQMPPDYTTNNDLQVDVTNSSGTLMFLTPTTATNLAILSGGSGTAVINYTVTHSDSTVDSGSISCSDWFTPNGVPIAWGANGRISATGGYDVRSTGSGNTTNPYLYCYNITVSGNSPIVSITFTYSSGGHEGNFYAISGNASGASWTPIPVYGFNQITTVAATFPLTATMDQGTNTVNNGNLATWFEQGYIKTNTSYGLPASGSTFSSSSQPTHHYQLGNFSANNAILIDTNHKSANITPAVAAPYTAFALLTGGGNIGTTTHMTNICILQHANGFNETNVFTGYDWFDNVPGAIAWVANGRVNMYNRTVNTLGAGNPKLFETFFFLSDTVSPVTNIMLQYKSAPSTSSTTYILAVSATAGGLPPQIGVEPQPQSWYPSQTASFTVSLLAGTPPVTNTWMVESNGVYYPLTDGVDANGSIISGSSTTNLVISDLTLADGTNYMYVASNAVGSASSTPALLTVNSGSPNPPSITAQTPPASVSTLTVFSNQITRFSVTASGAPPLTYQWYNGASPIPNATNSSYTNVDIADVTISCTVSNFVSTANSSPVSLVLTAPSLYQSNILSYHPVGYWPLNESSGTVAFDYAGNNNGTYNGSYSLGQAGIPATAGIGANRSVGFDGSSAYVDIPLGNLNITGPMTMIEWVQTSGESSFTTSIGHSDNSYRFDVDPTGYAHFADDGPDIITTTPVTDGNWHQLVGVYDGTNQYFYVDGVQAGNALRSTPTGSTLDVYIGGDPSYYPARLFSGNIAQVAILTNALTKGQVQSAYYSLLTPPIISITPAAPSIYAGASVTLTAFTNGTPPLSLQWFDVDTSNNTNIISGATNSTYTINNADISLNGYIYGISATNLYGSTNATVTLTVQNGPAYVLPGGDISPLNGEAYVGAPVIYTVNAGGSTPLYYQWTLDGTPISGATNSSLTNAATCGSHVIQVAISNAFNGGSPTLSSSAVLEGDAFPTNLTFNSTGVGWQLNTVGAGGVPTISGNVLEVTDGTGGEASSAIYGAAQYVGNFTASFTYMATGSILADGTTFMIENSSTATNALGAGGGGLGYATITNSAALEINLYNFVGIAAGTNGATYGDGGGAVYGGTGAVNITTGDPIDFLLNYSQGNLSVTLTDTSTSATFTTNYTFNSLTTLLGGTDLGYIGFSGGSGFYTSVQTISNFQFSSVMTPVALTVSHGSAPGSLIISWPAVDPNYVLQQTTSLASPFWTAGPSPVAVGGTNKVTVSASGSQQYYRLVRLVCQ